MRSLLARQRTLGNSRSRSATVVVLRPERGRSFGPISVKRMRFSMISIFPTLRENQDHLPWDQNSPSTPSLWIYLSTALPLFTSTRGIFTFTAGPLIGIGSNLLLIGEPNSVMN